MNIKSVNQAFQILNSDQKKRLIFLFFLMLIGMALETLSISLFIPIFKAIQNPKILIEYDLLNSILGFSNDTIGSTIVIKFMLLVLVIFIGKNSFLIFVTFCQNNFSYDILVQISDTLFRKYMSNNYVFHLNNNSSLLYKNIIIEVDNYVRYFITPFLNLVTEGLIAIGLFSLIFVQGSGLNLWVFAGIGVVSYFINKGLNTKINNWSIEREKHEGLKIKNLQQGLNGFKEIKLLNKEHYFLNAFSVHNKTCAKFVMRQVTLQSLPRMWLEVMAIFGIVLIVLIKAWESNDVSSVVPELVLIVGVLFRLLPSGNRIYGSIQALKYGVTIIDLLKKNFHDVDREVLIQDSKTALLNFEENIVIKDLTFSYEASKKGAINILEKINFSISKGESIGIMGESGSGKSTLIDIFLGLLDLDKGEILVDGININTNLTEWRSFIGYVPQKIYLTDDSIIKNIAFGVPEAMIDKSRIKEVVKLSQLDELVQSLPNKEHSIVGEGGAKLSGGQIQRIGIARALYFQPKILIFDEATSALDISTEERIVKTISKLKEHKTIIAVAHRSSALKFCDRIIEVKNRGLTRKEFA